MTHRIGGRKGRGTVKAWKRPGDMKYCSNGVGGPSFAQFMKQACKWFQDEPHHQWKFKVNAEWEVIGLRELMPELARELRKSRKG